MLQSSMGNNLNQIGSVTISTPKRSDHASFHSSVNDGSVSQAREDCAQHQEHDEDVINDLLLQHLHNMNRTLNDTRYGRGEREDRVQMIMCRELLTLGYTEVKTKMYCLRYGSTSTFVQVGPVSELIAPSVDVEMM